MNYTDLDYASLRARLLALATSAFPDVPWDASASLELLLLELHAHVGDVLGKYINNAAREARWGTAQQRRSLLSLCKLIGYRAPGARAAQAPITFTLAAAPAAAVTFPAGTLVRTAEVTSPAVFRLLADVVIPAGATTATGTAEHSSAASDAYVSSGLSDQKFTLGSTPFLDGSLVVTAADGAYAEVSNFLASTPSSKHFTVAVDDLDRATVTFGDGTNGSIPSGTITFAYSTGGGASGNVSASKINRIDGNWTDANGGLVRVTVTNATAAAGGTPRASVAQIRVLAPESLRVLGRAIAREDFAIVARGVPLVSRALCLTSNEDPSVGENAAILFLVPTGGGTASPALCSTVRAQFYGPSAPYPTLQTLALTVQTSAYLTLDISTKVHVRKGYSAATVAASIRSRLSTFFGVTITPAQLWDLAPEEAKRLGLPAADTRSQMLNPLVDYGYLLQDSDGEPTGSFAWSDVFNIIRDTPGVLKIAGDAEGLTLNGLNADVAIARFQFPRLGSVSVVNAADGSAL